MTAPATQPLKNFVTQWGNDPMWLSPFVSGVAPKRDELPAGAHARPTPPAHGCRRLRRRPKPTSRPARSR